MAHDHDCFDEARASMLLLEREQPGRAGHFLYVGNDADDDAHYRGNTAFASGVFLRLVKDVLGGHVSGSCEHCDRVALALAVARDAFARAMRGTPGSC